MAYFGCTIGKGMTLLLIAASLTGCVTTAQNGAGGGSPMNDNVSDAAAWNQMTAGDPEGVRVGLLPPDVLKYDAQIAALMSQAQAILATKDKARARVWTRDMDGLVKARSQSIITYSRTQAAKAGALADALGNGRPDPCLSPMGRNICASPQGSAGRQGGTHVCGAGPGPGEVQVGGTPGGQGVGATPLCDWVR